jgi:hypothetical protein
MLERKHGIRFNDTLGVVKAFYRGLRVHQNQDFKTRKTGRKENPDAVQQVIVHDLVCDARQQGHSLNEAYRIARNNEWAMIFKKGRVCRPSIGAIKAIYLKIRRQYDSRTA